MKKIPINLKGDSYPVFLGYPLGQIGARLASGRFGRKVLILTDRNVARLYADRVSRSLKASGKEVRLVEVVAGEKSKSLVQAYRLVKECSGWHLERTDTLLTLGGGVISDLGGFVASVYLRGINWVAVPTTLVAQVDASIGGKTGVNLPWGKNLVGSFYQPAFVYIDPGTLTTLPARQIRQGLAEIIKCGVIRNRSLFCFLEKAEPEVLPAKLPSLIEAGIKVKKYVVERDEKERIGLREILNFGHTLGHGIEIAYLPKYNHGEAVALGMAGETFLAWKLGLCSGRTRERIESVLRKHGLPWNPGRLNMGKIAGFLKYDKKTRAGKLRLVLPRSIGRVARGVRVETGFIVRIWREYAHGKK